MRHTEKPDLVVRRFGGLSAPQAEFHVRLARTKPDVTGEDIVDGQGVFARDHKRARRCSGRARGKFHAPLAVHARGCLGLLAVESHRDFFARIGPTPNRERRLLLQDHVVTEDRGKFHVRVRGESGHEGGEAGQDRKTPGKAARRLQGETTSAVRCGR